MPFVNCVSEKEISHRRSQPSSRSVMASGESRKGSMDRTALLRLSEKNARKERDSLQTSQGMFTPRRFTGKITWRDETKLHGEWNVTMHVIYQMARIH